MRWMMRRPPWRSAALTHPGLKRQRNEDSVLEAPESGVWVVADGMGGHDQGHVASAIVTAQFRAELTAGNSDIVQILQRAHATICERREQGASNMGTTAVALQLEQRRDRYRIAWIGDSRAYLLRGGVLQQLTQDHSLSAELQRRGVISADEAARHPERHTLSRALGMASGDGAESEVETIEGQSMAGDLFLLCSDGLSGPVPQERIARRLRGLWSLDFKARQLLAATLRAGAPDNVSIILVRVTRTMAR